MFKYFNWGTGQPVDKSHHDCFQMKSSDGNRWHNVDCLTPLPFICMIGESLYNTKAYIPLRRKKVALGPGIGLVPQRHYFALGIPTCWYLKMLKFAFPPTQNPNTSQWNIGCVGSLALGPCVGHVHFIFFV